MRKNRLAEVLAEIPWKVWEHIVRREPEWYNMESFLNKFSHGPFAVLMVTTGLNDYQLKGKPEVAYWTNIRKVLEVSTAPKSLRDLGNILELFYQKERLNPRKVKCLRRFLKVLLQIGCGKALREKFLRDV